MTVVRVKGFKIFTSRHGGKEYCYHRQNRELKPIADTPLVKFDKPLIVRIRDKATTKGRRQANYVKTVLSLLFAWGCERGFLGTNPAAGIKSIRRQKGLPVPIGHGQTKSATRH